MRLCTFEIRTSLGRHWRLGAAVPRGIVDLNFTCAWHLARKGEPRPYAMADVLVPDSMLGMIQGGLTSTGFARAALEALQSEIDAGRTPAGMNGETLLYSPGAAKLIAPLPHPTSLRDFYAFEDHVKKGFEKRGEPMPKEWSSPRWCHPII